MITLADLLTDNIDTGAAMRPYYKVGKDDLIKIKADLVTLMGGLGNEDPQDYPVFFEDFISGNHSTGTIGMWGWSFTNGSVSSGAMAGRPGVLTRISSTTNDVSSSLYPTSSTSNARIIYDDIDYVEVSFALLEATSEKFKFGIFDNVALNIPNGIWIGADTSVGAFFYLNTGNGASLSQVSTGVALDAGWHTCRITLVNDGTTIATITFDGVEYTIDNATYTNNPDAGGLTGAIIGYDIRTLASPAAKWFYTDYVKMKVNISRGV